MATLPPRHCHYAGHPPYSGRHCPLCHAKRRAAADARRPTAKQRGYTSKWSKARAEFLARPENRLCVVCGRPAEVVDHRIAHKGDMALFWDRRNWQAMCRGCNARKAIKFEGGFGRPIPERGGD